MTNNLQIIAQTINASMEEADKARERALPLHRQSIRESSLAIRAIHRCEFDSASQHLQKAGEYLREAETALKPHPEIFYAGFLQDAQKEYAEASITYSVITSSDIISPEELSVDFAPYANGLAEAVGEMRRHVLDHIRKGEIAESEHLLEIMDEIFYVLTSLDFPDGITRGLRRSTDIARGCLEKTRGDLTANYGNIRLEQKVAALMKKLDGAD